MQNNLRYINLSWAVVAICEDGTLPLSTIVHDGQDEVEMVEHYVIGYMAFWHIAFVDEDCLVPCNDDALRNDPAQRCPPQDRPLHRRPSTRRDISPLLSCPASPTHRHDGIRRHEPRVPDVTLRNVTNPMNICSDFHLGRHFSAFAEGFFLPFL